MRNRKWKLLTLMMVSALAAGTVSPIHARAEEAAGEWREEDGNKYWYENDVKQGTEGRGKEIYDPGSDAWYWLDAVDGGKMAVSKDVYQESDAGDWAEKEDGTGKWVRYDENGHMVKGWDTNEAGTYYFDHFYGTMAKGNVEIEGVPCWFDEGTGIGVNCEWRVIDGVEYWYEGGVRQGLEGRGKEIYDGASDAWYWLDSIDKGKKAVSKDVYQESEAGPWAENADGTGKWVRYDAQGHMVKGWDTNEAGKYYFDPTYGTMAKGIVTIEGKTYKFDSDTGVCKGTVSVYTAWLQEKVEYLDEDNKVTSYSINEYAQGNGYPSVSKRFYYYPAETEGAEDKLYQVEEYTRDSNGYTDSQIVYTVENGTRTEAYKYEYTYENGRQTEHKYTNYKNPDNNQRRVYGYDENGNRVDEKSYNSKDILVGHIEYIYEGKLLTVKDQYEIPYGGEELKLTRHEVYSYDNDGNRREINSEYYGYSKGEKIRTNYFKTVYTYENGKMKEVIESSKSGESDGYVNSSRYVYEYDENGNRTKYTFYRWNYSMNGWAESAMYEYSYDKFNNSYYEMTYDTYSNKNYLRPVESPEDWQYTYGRETERDTNGRAEKVTYYTTDKKINYYWDYDLSGPQEGATEYSRTNVRYDGDDNQLEATRYTYKKYTYTYE